MNVRILSFTLIKHLFHVVWICVRLISVEFETKSSDTAKIAVLDPPSDNFRHIPESGVLVFPDYVYGDGNTALVCGETCVRHWNTYRGPKHRSLFSVKLAQKGGIWSLGEGFIGSLAGTTHSFPVESFGGKDDFDASKTHVMTQYAALDPDRPIDPELPLAWHTEQNAYVVDLKGQDRKEVTSRNAVPHSPVFSNDGAKVTWVELAEDGHESDLAVLVVYDLKKAGSNVRVKVLALPVPASKPSSDKKPASPSSPYLVLVFSEPIHEVQRRGEEDPWVHFEAKGISEDDDKKWAPLSLAHGGPQGAWEDRWPTKWNTGDLTDAIKEEWPDWGGKPLVERDGDISSSPEQPWLGFGLKALVCHDEPDSQDHGYSTDELFFLDHSSTFNRELGGQPWKNDTRELTKFSSSDHAHKRSTPKLITHRSKDYRLPKTDGIATFHALQKGVPGHFVIFSDGGRWVLNHGNSLEWWMIDGVEYGTFNISMIIVPKILNT
ncbi:hypothetical protein BDM02DRAFT_3128157 [Thelephora ganbajun]|uniref:Uncharacterized protein n=1 Tax=Thelephora ganbajun TaxID=370292 RepID=A0ACB6ZJW7_THEGA|nr:hypothetical protein BDM02DRAFT_3128157 [Thelephora ganbajun]